MKKSYFFTMLFFVATTIYSQSNEEIDLFLAKEKADLATASYFTLSATGINTTVESAPQYFKDKKWLKNVNGEDAVTASKASYIIMKAFGQKGGLWYSMIPSPRYAIKEMKYLGIMDTTTNPSKIMSGSDFMILLSEYISYRADISGTIDTASPVAEVAAPIPPSPVAEVVISPIPFSPDNDGVDDETTIEIKFKALSGIKEWKFEILDPYKNSFRSFSGEGMPPENIVWDGKGEDGELVQSAEDYPWILTTEDNFDNKSTYSGIIPIGVLVIQDGDDLEINISSINFAPDSSQLATDNPEIIAENEKIINQLVETLNKYSSYKIKIEGHTNNLSWSDPVKAAEEEELELIPLSNARCETIKQLLAEKGITLSRMSNEGVGGLKPIVPFSDTVNRWKNRRVEFILIK